MLKKTKTVYEVARVEGPRGPRLAVHVDSAAGQSRELSPKRLSGPSGYSTFSGVKQAIAKDHNGRSDPRSAIIDAAGDELGFIEYGHFHWFPGALARYEDMQQTPDPLGYTPSGKPVLEPDQGPYLERFRPPKYNSEVTVLVHPDSVPKAYREQLFPGWTKEDHRAAAQLMSVAAQAAESEWNKLVESSVRRHGNGDGRLISGIYREHFPEETKDTLRYLARFASDAGSASVFHHHATGARTPWRNTPLNFNR